MTSPLIDENALMRRIEDIERQIRELAPSIAESTSSIVANLVTFTAADPTVAGFTVPSGTSASVLSTTIAVPAGYTAAAVIGTSSIAARNNSGTTSYLYSGLDIGGYSGDLNISLLIPNGSLGVCVSHQAQSLTGLTPGGTFTVSLRAKGDPAWGAVDTSAGFSVLAMFSK